jgi:hypothetical protein
MPEFENENERELADLERRRALQKEVAMFEFERAPFAAIEQFLVVMTANGYTEKEARAALHIVGAVPPGDGAVQS